MIENEKNREDLINYRINRAEETLFEAKVLAENKYWNSTVNRLYYACFYIVSALLVKNNIKHGTHDGTKNQFGLHFVKTGVVSMGKSKFYSRLFNKRGEADYEDFIEFTQEEVEPMIAETSDFIDEIKRIVNRL